MAVFFVVFKSNTLKNAFRRPKDAFGQKSVYKTPNACIMYEASVKIRKSVIIVDNQVQFELSEYVCRKS